jgi:hypothetical protein
LCCSPSPTPTPWPPSSSSLAKSDSRRVFLGFSLSPYPTTPLQLRPPFGEARLSS